MKLKPIPQLRRRFDFNLERVSHLLTVHEAIKGNRRLDSEYHSDILRSAIVLLHAALEDLLRELIRIKARINPAFLYSKLNFPLADKLPNGERKISVQELVEFDDLTVRDLIEICVDHYIDNSTYNNEEQIAAAIRIIGLKSDEYKSKYVNACEAVSRRHKIVHEGDRQKHDQNSHGRRNYISESDVENWRLSVEELGSALLNHAEAAFGQAKR